ncbi:MAG: ABC transporter ATP-binding protein [Thermoplasmatota archaeon]
MGENDFLTLKNVSKNYNSFPALKKVSFEIEKGDVFGYIGPNGAGKTTTIKILTGLITDFTGKVTIDGMKMPGQRDKLHKILGYLPQNVSFQDWRTVEHALKTFGELSEIDVSQLDERVEEVLKTVGLEGSKYKKVKELSGGNVQKLGLAQALLHKPKLLVFDEPLSGLDPASRYQVKQIVKELSKGETTVFFSSHILSDVQDVATKIGILSRGEILDVGSLEELKEDFSVPNVIDIELFKDTGKEDLIRSIKGIEKLEKDIPNEMKVKISKEYDIDEVSNILLNELLDQRL